MTISEDSPTSPRGRGKARLSLVEPKLKKAGLTVRQEQFSVDVASGMRPVDAYLKNYTWNGTHDAACREASRLKSIPHVKARIDALRDEYALSAVEASRGPIEPAKARAYTVSDAMDELDQAMAVAKSKENAPAMAKVVEVRMRLYGLGIGDAKNPADVDLPPEELESMLVTLRKLRSANG